MTRAPAASARGPRIALGALVALTLVAALGQRWDTALNVDNRTYLDMIDGVVRTGLPVVDNGPVADFPELQPRWLTLRGARLWGALPPGFVYAAAPFYALGGVRGVIGFNLCLLGLLALGVGRLGSRLSDHLWVGPGAAWLTLAATTIWGSSLDASPYSLALTLTVWSTAFAWDSLDTPAPGLRRTAFLAGLTGSLATTTHLLAAPMLAALVGLFAVLPGDPGSFPQPTREWLRDQVRDPAARSRVLFALLGAAPPLLAVGILNRVRFGSFNPVTYGPCVWRSCAETGLDVQGLGPMLEWFGPLLVWGWVSAVALAATRRHRAGLAATMAVSLLALSLPGPLGARAGALGRLLYGLLVDVSPLDLGFGYVRAPDGLGVFLGPFVVRSLLAGAPCVVLALGAPFGTGRERRATALLALPCVALLGALALRANIPVAYALGYPFLGVRYVFPALPFLGILSAWTLGRLGFSGRWVVAAGLVALGLAVWFGRGADDGPFLRRVLLLRAPLGLGAVLLLLLAAVRSAPVPGRVWALRGVAVLALGLSAGASLGGDMVTLLTLRRAHEARMARIARHLPARVGLYGFPIELDPVVSLRRGRDLQFADLYETRSWAFAPLVRRWWAEGRAVFAVHRPGDVVAAPWPGVRYEAVDRSLGLWRVVPQ